MVNIQNAKNTVQSIIAPNDLADEIHNFLLETSKLNTVYATSESVDYIQNPIVVQKNNMKSLINSAKLIEVGISNMNNPPWSTGWGIHGQWGEGIFSVEVNKNNKGGELKVTYPDLRNERSTVFYSVNELDVFKQVHGDILKYINTHTDGYTDKPDILRDKIYPTIKGEGDVAYKRSETPANHSYKLFTKGKAIISPNDMKGISEIFHKEYTDPTEIHNLRDNVIANFNLNPNDLGIYVGEKIEKN